MSKKHHSEDLPPPVTDRSSKTELWDELCAARGEIDGQQIRLNQALAENASLRSKLAAAYLRLNVIQAALSHHDAA